MSDSCPASDPCPQSAAVGDSLKKWADDLYHQFGSKEEVNAAVRAFYQSFVKPIDLPYVPNLVIEPAVDKFFEDKLVALVDKLHDSVHPE